MTPVQFVFNPNNEIQRDIIIDILQEEWADGGLFNSFVFNDLGEDDLGGRICKEWGLDNSTEDYTDEMTKWVQDFENWVNENKVELTLTWKGKE